MTFKNISADKLVSVRELIKFLNRLRVIGTLKTRTERIALTEFGKPCLYSLHYKDYDPSTKNRKSLEDELEIYFRNANDIYDEY